MGLRRGSRRGVKTTNLNRPATDLRVKVVSLATVLLGGMLAGCTLDGTPTNPNLLAPKVILQAWPDGNLTVYVHSAFGEHDYDWLALAIDNETVANRTDAYSLEERVPTTSFFLTVRAGAADQVYELQARVDVDDERERARVAFLDAGGEWADPRTFSLPVERILDRVTTGASA